jgi:hypothetical protein
VGVSQIDNVDVIAKARAVWRRIVLAENLERGTARCCLERARDHVDFRRVIFPQLAVRIRARRIEVTQANRSEAVRTFEVRQRVLHCQFRLAVGVDRRGGVCFANRRSTGSPYTAHVDEKMNRRHCSAAIASSVASVPAALFR